LPRDASQQVMVGKTVAEGKEEIDKLKPGDLLFFGFSREDGSERITHVGIYIGDGKFIHEAGDVNILSFNPEDKNYSEYRYNMFIRAKDVINHIGELGVKRVWDVPLFAH
jgi:cell wall-associated NlpC family hydrolase